MRKASYLADTNDKYPVIAIAPDMNWHAPHDRNRLGDAFVADRQGTLLSMDPATFETSVQSG